MHDDRRHVRLSVGVLAWDGAALELFRTDGRQGSWRLHGSTVVRWEIEPHRKGPQFLVWYSSSLRELTILEPADVAIVTDFMTSLALPRRGPGLTA